MEVETGYFEQPAMTGDPIGPRERWTAASLVVATFLLRLVCAYHYRFDSDETQHLHVVWAWTRGFLPYRDLFDNHAPLFHLLCAPLLAASGEHPDSLYLMRLAMLPTFVADLICVRAMGRALFDARTALWATVVAGLWPSYFLTSLEFRTDDLWAALWMVAITTVSCGGWTRTRSLLAGLILGAAFGVSMKSSLLLAAFVAAGLATRILDRRDVPAPARGGAREMLAHVAWFWGGLVFIPGVLAAFFAARGAFPSALYCTIGHNILPGLGLWRRFSARTLTLLATLPILWLGRRAILRADAGHVFARRRVFVFLASGLYLAMLLALWPLITPQDYLPFIPLAALLGTALMFAVARRTGASWRGPVCASALAVSIAGELAAIGIDAAPWQNATRVQTRLVSDVLRLTTPTEYVMDLKGETLFRPRSFYWVLEGITMERIRRGMIPDRIPERLVATHTAVVAEDSPRFPARARSFMNANYVPVSGVRVLGRLLNADAAGRWGRVRFTVNVADRYALVTPTGPARGWLDDERYACPRFLARGIHVFRGFPDEGRLALVWDRALERGFSPFSSSALDP